jgi:hypothetical protein
LFNTRIGIVGICQPADGESLTIAERPPALGLNEL